MSLEKGLPIFGALVVSCESSVTVSLPVLVELQESLLLFSVHAGRINIVLDNCVIVINVGFKNTLSVDRSVTLSGHGGQLFIPSSNSIIFLGGFLLHCFFDILSEHFKKFQDLIYGVVFGRGGHFDKRFDDWTIRIKFLKMLQRLEIFSDLLNFSLELHPTSAGLESTNNFNSFCQSINSRLMLDHGPLVGFSLFSSKLSACFDQFAEVINVFNGLFELFFRAG